jgi:release factor glutamine methyltransferase
VGWVGLEHGSQQGEAVRALLRGAGFARVRTERDLAGLERVSVGC